MSGLLDLTNYEVSSVDLVSIQPSKRSISQSGISQSVALPGAVWEISVTINGMTRAEFGQLMGFIEKQQGGHDVFTLILPGYDLPIGNPAGSPAYVSKTNDNQITINGLSAGATVKAGDLFNIAGSTKVFQVSDDKTEISGQIVLDFTPKLNETISPGAALTFTNPVFTVRIDDDKIKYSRSGLLYNSFTLNMIEVL